MDYRRQSNIITPETIVWPFRFIGLGGIGSAAVLPFLKLGVREFTFFDDDLIEALNLPNQLIYREKDIGKAKVEAAAEILRECSGSARIDFRKERLQEGESLSGIVISGVDSMASRKEVWQAVKRNFVEVPLYLDGRLGGETLELHTVRPCMPEDAEIYEQNLWDDNEIPPDPCGGESIIHPAVVLAGLMANQLTRWTRKEKYYRKIEFCFKTMCIRNQYPATW
jgi:hypothetical protein